MLSPGGSCSTTVGRVGQPGAKLLSPSGSCSVTVGRAGSKVEVDVPEEVVPTLAATVPAGSLLSAVLSDDRAASKRSAFRSAVHLLANPRRGNGSDGGHDEAAKLRRSKWAVLDALRMMAQNQQQEENNSDLVPAGIEKLLKKKRRKIRLKFDHATENVNALKSAAHETAAHEIKSQVQMRLAKIALRSAEHVQRCIQNTENDAAKCHDRLIRCSPDSSGTTKKLPAPGLDYARFHPVVQRGGACIWSHESDSSGRGPEGAEADLKSMLSDMQARRRANIQARLSGELLSSSSRAVSGESSRGHSAARLGSSPLSLDGLRRGGGVLPPLRAENSSFNAGRGLLSPALRESPSLTKSPTPLQRGRHRRKQGAVGRLPEIPGLRYRFHSQCPSQAPIAGAQTKRRILQGVAKQLGLDEGDWDQDRAYEIGVADLEMVAMRKVIEERKIAAMVLQRGFHSRDLYQATKRVLAGRRTAASQIQRWWRVYLYSRKPVYTRVQHRIKLDKAARKLQAATRGWLTRLRWKHRVRLKCLLMEMGDLRARLRPSPDEAARRIQALARGWLERRRRRRLREEAAEELRRLEELRTPTSSPRVGKRRLVQVSVNGRPPGLPGQQDAAHPRRMVVTSSKSSVDSFGDHSVRSGVSASGRPPRLSEALPTPPKASPPSWGSKTLARRRPLLSSSARLKGQQSPSPGT